MFCLTDFVQGLSYKGVQDRQVSVVIFFSYIYIYFLSHLIAGCDIGVQISVRPSVRPFVRPSTFTSKFGFLDIRDSCESETLHSNCP